MDTLVKLIGFPATLIHGDLLVVDRWQWLKKRLPIVNEVDDLQLLDVGCGSGAFTIGAAKRGYNSIGLSWDERNQKVAMERALLCKADKASFKICDVRDLDKELAFTSSFDFIICTENIEHIINDQKLMIDMQRCLKPGGVLLLTTPNYDMIPMYGESKSIITPVVEDGGHVRVGYTEADLRQLCQNANLIVDEVSYCSGFFSQKLTSLLRRLAKFHYTIAWFTVLPLRILPLVFDKYINYTKYSICLVAHKV